jgi:hypothetical protein
VEVRGISVGYPWGIWPFAPCPGQSGWEGNAAPIHPSEEPMAEKPQSALAIRKAALKEAKTAYDAKFKQLKQEREALIKQARESRAMVKESQEVALESTQRNAALMQTVTEQNGRGVVGSTIFLSSVCGNCARPGSEPGSAVAGETQHRRPAAKLRGPQSGIL